jgi:signal transduction histidine kinase/CheY-like chemotaxis protein
MRLRAHLVILVLAVLVPMIVFAATVVAMFGRQQRADVERGAVETARAMINTVDEALDASIAVLEALATSRTLDDADLRAFYVEARRVVQSRPEWFNVVLIAPDGQQVVNTIRPLGGALPKAFDRASVEALVATRRPVVGNVTYGAVIGQHAIPVRVPVIRGGALTYVLTASLKPTSLLDVLGRQRIASDWVASVFDPRKTIAARTSSAEQFIGKSISEDFVALLDRSGAEGWAMTRTLEGRPVYTAFARSPVTGWGIGIGIPIESVDAPLYRSFVTVLTGGTALIVGALLLATLIGRRITTPIAALAARARTFGEGGGMQPGAPASVAEVEDMRRAFVDAAALVERRAAEAAEANRAKDEFLAVLSHELRTPLNAVYGWARMLQSGGLDPESAARAVDVIVRQADAQVQLIDDLLDVSRVVAGKMRLDVRPVELTAIVEGALDAVRPAAAAKDIRLEASLSAGPGTVVGDPSRLQQIVWNLVMNAVKFTPTGGRVSVRLRRTEAHAEIVVTDTGRGIDAAVLPYIFDRFRQADSSPTRAHAGLGLGLALAKHLVELHGGSLSAQSDGADKGATFVVRLPLARADRSGARDVRTEREADDRPASGVADLHGVRVLLVDDDADALDLGATILSSAGAEVRVSRSAADAVQMFQQWRPDVLVSDIEMPHQDGYSLIRTVRALPAEEGGRTPAVALTAYGRVQDRMQALNAGFTMHVPKPADPAELTAIVANLAAPATA